MKIITQQVPGTLLDDGERIALLLNGAEEPPVHLAYALTTQGVELRILPSSLLDDWGTEISNLGLYDWVRDNGLSFPRAEVFGFDPQGSAVQYFLRDLELFARYHAYVVADTSDAATWRPLSAVLVPDAGVAAPEPGAVPEAVHGPLRAARLSWWRVPTYQSDLGFLADVEPEPD